MIPTRRDPDFETSAFFCPPRGQQKQGSALSDDLLANLNALLNGGQEP